MQYVDFLVRVRKDGDDFSVSAESTDSAGRKTGEAGPVYLEWAALQQNPAWGRIEQIQQEPYTVKATTFAEVGGMLFDALLQGQVLRLFTGLYDHEVEPNKDTALRFRLDIDERSPQVAVVPWEFLYWRDKRLQFATSIQILFTRQLLNMDYGGIKRIKVDSLPRVLLVIPEGSGLNTDRERDIVKGALKSAGIEPTILESRVDIGRLNDVLSDSGPYHILHFIGHGDFEQRDASFTGLLRFNRAESSPFGSDAEWVDHSRIQALLQTYRDDLRLVILNSCLGAQIASDSARAQTAGANAEGRSASPPMRHIGVAREEQVADSDVADSDIAERTGRGFIGVAPSILKAGIPAVLAMQYKIRDDVAIQFAETLYKRLTRGRWAGQIDAAVTLARNACLLNYPDDRGYATSVLYLRSEDGIVFDLPKEPSIENGLEKQATAGTMMIDPNPCPPVDKPDDDVLALYRFDTAKDLWGRMQVARRTLATQNDLIKRLEAQVSTMEFTNPAGAAVLRMQIEQLKEQRDKAQDELAVQSSVLAWLVFGECQKQQANKAELDGLLAKSQRNLSENRRVSDLRRMLSEYDDLAKDAEPFLRESGVIA